jgi:hypothetical protein
MAVATPYQDRRVAERRQIAYPAPRAAPAEGMRVSWGGIWGGVIAALGVLMLLSAIGLAVGVSAADPGTSGAALLGTGAAIWAAAALLVALFIGGMVATRIGATYDPGTGFWEGFLVWTVSVLLMGTLAASGIGLGAMARIDGADMSFSQQNVTAAWISVGGLLLSLLAAVLGAMSGRRD